MKKVEPLANRSWATLEEVFLELGVPASRLRKKVFRDRLGLEDHPRPRHCLDLRMTFITQRSLAEAKTRLSAFKKTK